MLGKKLRPFIHPVTGAIIPPELAGVIAPMFTPVDRQGRVDLKALRAYTEYLAANEAISTLFIRSGVGGMFTFREEEIEPVIELIAGVAKANEKPFLVGCPGTWSEWPGVIRDADRYRQESLRFGEAALARGAYAAVYPFPYGLLDPEQGGADAQAVYLRYFDWVAGRLSGRIVLYHVPQLRPEQWVTSASLAELMERHANIVGMKVSHGDVSHHLDLMAVIDETNFAYICGNELVFLPLLLMGACGLIGEGCNAIPEVYRGIIRAFFAGALADAREGQFVANEAFRVGQELCRDATGQAAIAPDSIGLGYLSQKGVYPFGPRLRSGGTWPSKATLEALAQAWDQLRGA